jgi:hypothetical protein
MDAVIRKLVWLAVLGTAVSCHARDHASISAADLDGRADHQSVSDGLPGTMVLGTTRIERSFRRVAGDERTCWIPPALASGEAASRFPLEAGHSSQVFFQGCCFTSASAAPFLCAQLQI